MSSPSINIEGLSKRYFISDAREPYESLRDVITNCVTSPFRRAGKLLRGHTTGAADLHKEYWALKDISLRIEPGEVVGLIGSNGAGKSTLLKILSRITEPTSGYAEIHGRVGSLLEVGTGFHPELTGGENIFLNGTILGMQRDEIKGKFDEIVSFAEIEKFIETPVKHYSSGMYLRLAFAVAAHLEPEILLVDEVLAVGDVAFQKKCLGRMEEVARVGRTVVFVSHNMAAVQNLCQRAVLLQSGEIVKQGNTRDVVEHYVKMNMLNGNEFSAQREEIGDRRAEIEHFTIEPHILQTGSPVKFTFLVSRGSSTKTALLAELAVSFITAEGVRLLQLYSGQMGHTFEIPSGRSQFTASVESLPLVPGNYYLSVWLGAARTPIHWMPQYCLVTVEPGCLTGEEFVESRGYPVVISSSWHAGE